MTDSIRVMLPGISGGSSWKEYEENAADVGQQYPRKHHQEEHGLQEVGE